MNTEYLTKDLIKYTISRISRLLLTDLKIEELNYD